MSFLLILWATAIQAKPAPPDPADQRAAEKLVRDIFKDDYAKKSPQDRSALARRLLSQAQEAGSDAGSPGTCA
jgi:hypothetical protein